MADTNENKTPDEVKIQPVIVEFPGTVGDNAPGEQSQTETLGQDQGENAAVFEVDAPPVLVTADGEKEKIAAQDIAAKDLTADDKLKKEQEELLKSLDSKADDFSKNNPAPKKKDAPAKAKAEKLVKADKPPKAQKANKAASVGGGGIGGTDGKSGKDTANDTAPVPSTPTIPEPPKDAKRPGGKETIV